MQCIKCRREIPENSLFCLHCGSAQQKKPSTRKPRTRGNGTGTAIKRGKTWEAQITLGKKKNPDTGKIVADRRTKGGFATKREALEYIPILKSKNTIIKKTATLEILWQGYSTSGMLKLSKSKQGHYTTAYNKLSEIIATPISNLTINDLQDIVDEKAPTYYPARDIKTLLSHLYNRAVAQQDVGTNLAEYIVLPALDEAEPNPFGEKELKALWIDYGNGNKLTGYILLMIYSGMMPGELFKAEKNMIDWEKQRIVGCGLKTKKRKEAPIVVADLILPVLRDLCNESTGNRLLGIRRDAFYDEFHAILARCGIEDRTPYACRHTTATALALGNIAPEVIKEVMRHTKFSTTERYIHKEVDIAPMLEAVNTLCK